ncbi:MAG: nitrate/nitrite transporter NrtS [Gammaproteobacteria bacterium]
MADWIRLALRPDIVRRSRKVALLVGTILIAINYGDRLLAWNVGAVDALKMILTYFVPYCVSTYAAVSAVRAAGEAVSASEPGESKPS